jgi:hypothetical protein
MSKYSPNSLPFWINTPDKVLAFKKKLCYKLPPTLLRYKDEKLKQIKNNGLTFNGIEKRNVFLGSGLDGFDNNGNRRINPMPNLS